MSEEKRFPMDPGEIVVDYRRAANKQKQIDVLANLNACQPRDIAELLQERGEELPKIWLTKLEKPRRGSPEDLANRGKKMNANLAVNYGDELPLPPDKPEEDLSAIPIEAPPPPKLGTLHTCEVCGIPYLPTKELHYIAVSAPPGGLAAAVGGPGLSLCDAFDCPHCGAQYIAQSRAQVYDKEAEYADSNRR